MNGELGGSARTVRVRSVEAPCPRLLGKRTQSCCSAPDGGLLAGCLPAHAIAAPSAG